MATAARGWLGLAARWLGPGNAAPIQEVVPSIVPVIVVGQDACDDGGMRGASVQATVAGAQWVSLVLTSSRGFALYSLSLRAFAGAPSAGFWRVEVLANAPAPGAGAPQTVRFLNGAPRDVTVEATVEAGAPPGGGWQMPVTVGESQPVQALAFARPLLVPPSAFLRLYSATPALHDAALLWEEGL